MPKRRYAGVTHKRKRQGPRGRPRTVRAYGNMKYKNPVHYFKRTTNLNTSANVAIGGIMTSISGDTWIVTPTGIGTVQYASFGIYFTLNMLPDYTEFTTLFDRYQIVGVSVKITPFSTSSEMGAAVGSTYTQTGMIIHTVTDYDDAAAPTASEAGIQTLREYESYRQRNMLDTRKGQTFKHYLRPHVATAVYGGAFTRFANERNLWIDAASVDSQYYGLKGIIEVSNGNASVSGLTIFIKAEATVYLKTKDLR